MTRDWIFRTARNGLSCQIWQVLHGSHSLDATEVFLMLLKLFLWRNVGQIFPYTFCQGDRGTSPGCFPKWARWLPCRVPPSLPAISPPIFQLWVFHLVQEVSEIANPSKAHLSLLSTLYLSLSSLLLLYPDTGNIDPITEIRGIPVQEVVLELWSCCLSVGP